MTAHVKVSGAWKNVASVHTKVSGAWKTAADMPVKIAGVWKTGILANSSFESIATATGTGSSNTITFSSIPSTYKSLQIRIAGKSTRASNMSTLVMQLNSDTGTNYSRHSLQGNGTTPSANSNATYNYMLYTDLAAANLTNINSVFIVDIIDYASTSKNKTARIFNGQDNNSGSGVVYLSSGLWMNTSAVNTITFTDINANIASGSTFALYGIKG